MNCRYALVFANLGINVPKEVTERPPEPSFASDIRTEFGALTTWLFSAMFGNSQPVLLSFPLERPVS